MTTHEAAEYLAARGYTVGRRRAGGSGPPSGDTLKHWCKQGRFVGARKSGDRWLIPKEELDELITQRVEGHRSGHDRQVQNDTETTEGER